jgi:hypothetical protein
MDQNQSDAAEWNESGFLILFLKRCFKITHTNFLND